MEKRNSHLISKTISLILAIMTKIVVNSVNNLCVLHRGIVFLYNIIQIENTYQGRENGADGYGAGCPRSLGTGKEDRLPKFNLPGIG